MELDKLAEDAAALLITNASTDLWTGLKSQMSRLLSRSQPQRIARIEQQLDDLHQEFATIDDRGADAGRTERFSGLWHGRIMAALEDHPEAVPELAELLASFKAPQPSPSLDIRISNLRADGNARQIVIGNGHLTLAPTAQVRPEGIATGGE